MPDSVVPAVDLDLRLVYSFTVVAEYGHFGHAAEALHTTQPSLSRQIRRLERHVGARLLDRTAQGSRLTEAGAAFLPLAADLLRSAARATASARAAAVPHRITIGYTSSAIVTAAVRELRHRNPDAQVETRHLMWDEPHAALLDHRVDVAVAAQPFPAAGLDVTVLYEMPRGVVVSTDHRLAGKESIMLDDIADEPVVRVRRSDPEWGAFWRIDPRPDGRAAPLGPEVETTEDKYEIVAAGSAVAIVQVGDPVTGRRPDLTIVPLEDVEPARVALATRSGDRNRLVAAFRACAPAHITAPGA